MGVIEQPVRNGVTAGIGPVLIVPKFSIGLTIKLIVPVGVETVP